jgi:hypothetical protein
MVNCCRLLLFQCRLRTTGATLSRGLEQDMVQASSMSLWTFTQSRQRPDGYASLTPGGLACLSFGLQCREGRRATMPHSPRARFSVCDDVLTAARCHVVRARQIVMDHRRWILYREHQGLDASAQRATLDVFEDMLAIYEKHLNSMLNEREKWAASLSAIQQLPVPIRAGAESRPS